MVYHRVVTVINSRSYSTLTAASESPDLYPVDYRMWEILQEKVFKILSLIWTNWNSDWERIRIISSFQQPFINGVVNRSRSVMRVLYTFCLNIPTRCNQLNSNLTNLEATVEVR